MDNKQDKVRTIILEYWDNTDYTCSRSEKKREETISGSSDIGIFEQFYKKNNQLKYCNGSYYKFKDKEWEGKYKNWLESDDYAKKSFELYYGNGVVD